MGALRHDPLRQQDAAVFCFQNLFPIYESAFLHSVWELCSKFFALLIQYQFHLCGNAQLLCSIVVVVVIVTPFQIVNAVVRFVLILVVDMW